MSAARRCPIGDKLPRAQGWGALPSDCPSEKAAADARWLENVALPCDGRLADKISDKNRVAGDNALRVQKARNDQNVTKHSRSHLEVQTERCQNMHVSSQVKHQSSRVRAARTLQVTLITQCREVEPLHVKRASLQTLPQCRRSNASAGFISARVTHTVAVLEGKRVQDMLCSLFVALMGMQYQVSRMIEFEKKARIEAHPQIGAGYSQVEPVVGNSTGNGA